MSCNSRNDEIYLCNKYTGHSVDERTPIVTIFSNTQNDQYKQPKKNSTVGSSTTAGNANIVFYEGWIYIIVTTKHITLKYTIGMQQYQWYQREVRTIQYEVSFRTITIVNTNVWSMRGRLQNVWPPFIWVDQGQRSCLTMKSSWEKIYHDAFSLHSSPFYIKRRKACILYPLNLNLKPYYFNYNRENAVKIP
jgi:hypothetical protein